MGNIIYSLNSVSPVFLIIAIGAILRRMGLIDENLSEKIMRLVFNIFLPALLLRSLILVDFQKTLSSKMLLVVWGTLFACFFIAWGLSRLVVSRGQSRGLFTSGAVWGNVAIMGYALGELLYGPEGLARAAIFSAVVMPLHMFIGYLSMGGFVSSRIAPNPIPKHAQARRPGGMEERVSKGGYSHSKLGFIANPVIVSIALGILLNLLPFEIPTLALNMLDILGGAGLPFALIAIGGSLRFRMANWGEPLFAAVIKLLVMPAVAFLIARVIEMDKAWTASIVIGFSCPTAISFFVVSRSLRHEASRAAAIVTTSTVGSALSAGVAVALLKLLEYA